MTWNQVKVLMNAKYYPIDVKKAKEQEFLHLDQGDMSIIEYVVVFNEFSHFAPTWVATKEIKMNHL